MGEKTYLSQKKYEELLNELDFLKSTRRQEVAELLESAKEFGDLSENAEYHDARAEQVNVEERVFELEKLLKSVEIVKHHKSEIVEVGTKVSIQKKGSSESKDYEIVGSEEADTKAGKISYKSPIGRAILGKKAGDNFKFDSPSGKTFEYSILNIS